MNEYPNGSYAVIFTSTHTDQDPHGYADMAQRMDELAARQPGYLGMSSVREGLVSTTVSYWASAEDARAWGQHPEHRQAQEAGRDRWYRSYSLQISRIEQGHHWRKASA